MPPLFHPPGGYGVQLDHRKLRTPQRQLLLVPTKSLAQAVAQEWESQDSRLQTSLLHLVKVCVCVCALHLVRVCCEVYVCMFKKVILLYKYMCVLQIKRVHLFYYGCYIESIIHVHPTIHHVYQLPVHPPCLSATSPSTMSISYQSIHHVYQLPCPPSTMSIIYLVLHPPCLSSTLSSIHHVYQLPYQHLIGIYIPLYSLPPSLPPSPPSDSSM